MNHDFALYGNIGKNIFEPSNGGNGIKLNTPSPMFIVTIYPIIAIIIIPTLLKKNPVLANFIIAQYINANIIAVIKFINGPANETIASAFSTDISLL